MKKKLMALMLMMALILTVGMVSAVAGDEPVQTTNTEDETEEATEVPAEGEEHEETSGETKEKPLNLAGPDQEPGTDSGADELLENEAMIPDEVGTVSFANVERRMREKNLVVLSMQESVDMLESIDYEDLKQDLREQLSVMADMQWGMISMGQGSSYAYAQLEQGYESLRAQFDAIQDGEMQEDNAGAMRQIRDLQDQVIMGGEMLYVTLAGLETQEAALQRQLASLNRTVEEMELRYQMGQISALQLTQAKTGRSSLVSGLETLRMNIRNYKMQLEMMLGAEQTGESLLGPVPSVTQEQLAAMDVEKDLLEAKANSYELYAAAKTLEDEKEAYEEAADEYNRDEQNLEFRKAKHNWQAAQYTYQDALQSYELRFRTLYAQVLDYSQIYEAAKVSLESQKSGFAASALKYQQGTISQNAYLTAENDLKAAEDTVQTAGNDLFSSYNTYCWAVQHGVLN